METCLEYEMRQKPLGDHSVVRKPLASGLAEAMKDTGLGWFGPQYFLFSRG